MNKHVGLMTSEESFLTNFGAALQGFALYKTILDLGYDCQIIRYTGLPSNQISPPFYKRSLPNLTQSAIQKINRAAYYQINKHKIADKKKLFQQFQNKNIRFWHDIRYSWETLHKEKIDFDILVCGSDQIWNPYYHGYKNDPGYFLQFGSNTIKRIAYAPSIGRSTIPTECENEFKEYLSVFQFLSVREIQGAKIIKRLINRDVPVMIDPTLLLEKKDWECVLKNYDAEKYILLYRFVGNHYIDEIARKVSKELNISIISIPMYYTATDHGLKLVFNVGPAEFLSLIKKATLVCTESFHATVFSILFDVPFLAFSEETPNSINGMDTRLTDLLNLVKLENHLILPEGKVDIKNILNKDYTLAHSYISEQREKGIDYLKKALGD